jgi:nitric oxide reductase NorD protein
MELDQWIFKKLYVPVHQFFSEKKRSKEEVSNTVYLEELENRLTYLASALCGEAIRIRPAEKEGGYKGNTFFLPKEYFHTNVKTNNIEFYLYRTVYLSAQKKMSLNWKEPGNYSKQDSIINARKAYPVILEYLNNQYPSMKERFQKVIELETNYQKAQQNAGKESGLSFLYGIWMEPENKDSVILKVENKDKSIKENLKEVTEAEGKIREEARVIETKKNEQENYTLNHNFEKIQTLEEFTGNWRDFDQEDEMEEHKDALDELDMRYMVRTEDPSHSVYNSELSYSDLPLEAKDIVYGSHFFTYPEWNFQKKRYMDNYCKVYTGDFLKQSKEYYSNTMLNYSHTLTSMKEKMNRLANKMESVKRMDYGDEYDLDAVVDHHIQLYSKMTPNERIYIAKRKRKRDMSVLLLVDLSLSTDSYLSNRRILDVEKESILLFGELCDMFEDRFQIDCFYSRTRNNCEYLNVKSFNDTWNDTKHRVGELVPKGYTRIGPAIRHAKFLLRQEKAKKRWILLLSDGKPNDYDRYEGRYGLEDVKKSILECDKDGIGLYALAIDKKAKDYLPQIFGMGRYQILPKPDLLPEALADFYSHLFK